MTFDEQLRRAFETLNDRLQDDIRREVQIAVDEAVAAKSAAETARAVDAADKNTRLLDSVQRSEERRVGKECRARGSRDDAIKTEKRVVTRPSVETDSGGCGTAR